MTQKGERPHEAENQNSPGVLKDVQIGRFNTTREDIAELPVKSIQQCPLIPDYKDPTESTLPIIVHTPKACFCIDGWNLVEQAQAEGQSTVRCHVYQIQEHSDTELALRKVEVRTKPVGGTCCYAELVRNTRLVGELLMDEMENPIVFSHGGSRRGASYTNNREDDLREVLSERLGKDRSTINAYLNFGRYLSNEVMDALVAQNTGRAFFEKAQMYKRSWIKNLESDGLDEESITNQISLKMLEWHREYQETGEIKADYGELTTPAETEEQDDQTTEDPSDNTPTDENESGSQQVNSFNHWQPSDDSEIPKFLKIDDAITVMQGIADTIAGLVHQSSFDCDQAIEIIDGQIKQLAMARQIVIDVRNRAAKEEA